QIDSSLFSTKLARYKVSEFTFLFGMTAILLKKVLDKETLSIGVPFSVNRQFPDLIGMFTNILPVIFRVEEEENLGEYLTSITKILYRHFLHQGITLPELLEELSWPGEINSSLF